MCGDLEACCAEVGITSTEFMMIIEIEDSGVPVLVDALKRGVRPVAEIHADLKSWQAGETVQVNLF